jgi:hypothetical protein
MASVVQLSHLLGKTEAAFTFDQQVVRSEFSADLGLPQAAWHTPSRPWEPPAWAIEARTALPSD